MTTTRQGANAREAASCNLCGREVLDDKAPDYVPSDDHDDYLWRLSEAGIVLYGRADFDVCSECQKSRTFAEVCESLLTALGEDL